MLRDLQLALARAFQEDGHTGEASRRVLPGLRPVGKVEPDRTLEIYQSALRSVVEGALREIFPVCAALVGDACFRGVARHYAARHASRRADLGRIGDALPELMPSLAFLDGVPYLADVARLELALHSAADAADPTRTAGQDAARRIADALSGAPDRWRFVLPPSATLLESEHPVRAIWSAHRVAGQAPSGDRTADDADRWSIEATSEPDRLIVWRAPDGLAVESVEAGLWPLLLAIGAGTTVAQLFELDGETVATELQEDPADHAPRLAAISLLFERGWIAGVEPVSDHAVGSGAGSET